MCCCARICCPKLWSMLSVTVIFAFGALICIDLIHAMIKKSDDLKSKNETSSMYQFNGNYVDLFNNVNTHKGGYSYSGFLWKYSGTQYTMTNDGIGNSTLVFSFEWGDSDAKRFLSKYGNTSGPFKYYCHGDNYTKYCATEELRNYELKDITSGRYSILVIGIIATIVIIVIYVFTAMCFFCRKFTTNLLCCRLECYKKCCKKSSGGAATRVNYYGA